MNRNRQSEEQQSDEDRLVRQLEKAHEQLMQRSSRGADPEVENDSLECDQSELGPALDMLKLIERVKKLSPLDTPQDLSLRDSTLDEHRGQLRESPSPSSATPDTSVSSSVSDDSLAELQDLKSVFQTDVHRVSRFEILEPLGQGGFGIVFRAYDPDLDREVAIKVPRPESLFTQDLQTRFVREGKAAAALSHPNIVTVYETGRHDSICYLASELVRGQTLDDWLAGQKSPLDPRAAAQLIATLADAVQHAHSRHVLHRDIKPTNILIEQAADRPVDPSDLAQAAKITDFGLAKFEGDLEQQTQTGSIVGTPAFMSPEQTRNRREAIGPASDVYSLGVLLYYVLTRTTPFRGDTLIETIRAVQEKEPVPPARINPAVPSDLGAIVQKCLEKEPKKRYGSARELYLELHRFLDGREVSARPVTAWQRTGKWFRRNPALGSLSAATAALILIALFTAIAGWVATSDLLNREKLAKQQSEQALLAEKLAKQQTEQALLAARQRFYEMKDAVDTYYIDVCENPQFKNWPGSQNLRKSLLATALGYYEQFVSEVEGDKRLTKGNSSELRLDLDLASTHHRIGEIQSELGQTVEARREYDKALTLLNDHLTANGEAPAALSAKADTLDRIAGNLFAQGETDKALRTAADAIEIQTELVARHPDNRSYQRDLADFQVRRSAIFRDLGQAVESRQALESALTIYERLSGEDTSDASLALKLAECKGQLSSVLRDLGDMPAAEQMAASVVRDFRRLVENDPLHWNAHENYAIALSQLAMFSHLKGDYAGAAELVEEAMPTINRLCSLHPQVVKYLRIKSGHLNNLGICYDRIGNLDRAESAFQESLETRRQICEIDPDNMQAKGRLAESQLNLGRFYSDHRRNLDAAHALLQDSLDLWKELRDQAPDVLLHRLGVANACINLAGLFNEKKELQSALTFSQRSVDLFEQLREEYPENPTVRHYASVAFRRSARTHDELGRYEEAIAAWKRALKLVPPPVQIEVRIDLAETIARSGDVQRAQAIAKEVNETIEGDGPENKFELGQLRLLIAASLLETKAENATANEELVQRQLGLATELISQAHATSPLTAEQFERLTTPRFDPVRDRTEFVELLSNIEPTNASAPTD